MPKKVKSLKGYSDCFYAAAYIVVKETLEEFESRKSTDVVDCDIWIADTTLQVGLISKHQVTVAKRLGNCVQFYTK